MLNFYGLTDEDMRRYVLIALIFLVLAPVHASTLTTPSFIVEVQEQCKEGEVTCDNVSYTGTSKKTGKSIKLRGKTLHTLCKDGVTPCRFLGYEFKNGGIYYRVMEDGNLLIMQGRKILVDETGKWD